MRIRASLALALVAWPALGQDASDLAPENAPAPAARPDDAQGDASGAPDPVGAASEVAPEPESPPPEEGDLAPSEEPPALIPPADDAGGNPAPPDSAGDEPLPGPLMREVLAETPEELAACLIELDALGAVYERTEPVTEPDVPDCGIANPVTVSEIAPGVSLDPALPMRCATALAAARWVEDVVLPLSRKVGRGDIVAIDQSAPYVCRPRADGQMSEHAWGNALDVMGFRFSEGEPIPVEPRGGDGTLEEAFQRAVRAGACLDFETVLGPGSDEDHADHLHFDVRARNGGFRICE